MKVQFQVENQKGGVGYKAIDRGMDSSSFFFLNKTTPQMRIN